MISNRGINLEKAFYEDLRRKLKNKYRGYPEGSICFRYEHGKHRPYRNSDGKLTYLKKEEGMVVLKLIDKKITEKRIKYINNNLRILDKLQKTYKGIEFMLGGWCCSRERGKDRSWI